MAAAGDKINGFILVRQLGAGGMGETWEGVRVVGAEFEQRVAIKVADRESLQHVEGIELFRREAALAASLRHPNIAAVIDVDEQLGCIVCELVDGADLRAVLRVSPHNRLSSMVLVSLMGQIARGLSHAHRRVHHGKLSPVVHRDMSPSNVVVDYDGNLKIVDFGIAKAIASADISETIKGKLSYMAPEQAMGTRIDGRVDQYALGVMAYEALAGVRPNDGAHDGETLGNILSGRHKPLSKHAVDLPPGLSDVIEKMLSVAPDQRFASMDGVIAALDPFTPPLTVHRELAELVLRARPAQTIVMQNGVFVSQPLAWETLVREPTPKSGRLRGNSGGTRGENQRGSGRQNLAATDPVAPRDVSMHPDAPKSSLPQLPFHATVPSSALRSGSSPPPLHEDNSGWFHDASKPGTRRWQAVLAAVGALVLGVLSWLMFSAEVEAPNARPTPTVAGDNQPPSEPPPNQATPPIPNTVAPHSASGAAGTLASNANGKLAKVTSANPRHGRQATDDTKPATDVKPHGPARDDAKDESRQRDTPLKPTQNTALARVSVVPRGRVWVDGTLQGSASPILEVILSPGPHEIAVGHERPTVSRTVHLQPGATQPVAFDLESK